MDILEYARDKIVFFDGGMGTILQERGLSPGAFPEEWNLTRRGDIIGIHRAYIKAGADVITTNTFGANGVKLREAGLSVRETVSAAVQNAREAVAAEGRGFVALDMGPTGKLLKPLGDLSFGEAYGAYAEAVEAGRGADLIIFETMGDTYEIKAGVLAAKENSSLPIFVTMILGEDGKLLTGGDIPAAVAMLEGLGVDAIGLNCGLGPAQMLPLLERMLRYSSLPVIMNPNAGLPVVADGKTKFLCAPEEFAAESRKMAGMGARFLGGCCGTTPEHIAAVKNACAGAVPKPVVQKSRTLVSSYGKAVEIGADPRIIGERINPTGKPKLKAALKTRDFNYIMGEALSQEDAGAHILDVNAGLPEADEKTLLPLVVEALQSVTALPLQMDTSDPAAMEAALRIYNGKALINSVNGKEASMREIFPLVKKYGGVVIGLTLDENIPETAEGRFAIAERIVNTAAEYGINKKDILIDPLTMAVSAGGDSGNITLETMELISGRLGVGTVLGVSNISFGLPQRGILNSFFFALAMERGLSAAIINPLGEDMQNAYRSFRALRGFDKNCLEYISAYSGETAKEPAPEPAGDLESLIIRGLKEGAAAAAAAELRERPPLEIINTVLVPALDKVGKGFETGRLFLPQLLMSAEAAKAAFAVVSAELERTGGAGGEKDKVIVATVKGDIHDIGKNIVKVLLENYGFDVLDMGKDVPPGEICRRAVEENIRLVGLSALMTTTVESMAETIRLIKAEAPGARVMVGGAVLTADYAKEIGADYYSKDAMEAVKCAKAVFGR